RLARQLAAEGGLDALAAGHRADAVAEYADVEIVPRLPRLPLRREEQLKQDLIEHPGRPLSQRLVTAGPGGFHRIGPVEQENHAARISPADIPLVHANDLRCLPAITGDTSLDGFRVQGGTTRTGGHGVPGCHVQVYSQDSQRKSQARPPRLISSRNPPQRGHWAMKVAAR